MLLVLLLFSIRWLISDRSDQGKINLYPRLVRHMGARRPWHFAILLSCLLFSSGSCISGKPPSAVSQQKQTSNKVEKEKRILVSQLDDVPVVNPTSPDTGNPSTINPPTPQGPFTTGPNPTISGPPQGANPTTPTMMNPPTTPVSSGGSGSWCIASASASPTALQVALDYACGYGGADCSPIQPGASCYDSNTVRDHASYAFNDYYQKNPAPTSCAFGGTAQLTNTDPSHGYCHFASSSTAQSMPPPVMQSPPSPEMPVTPATPTTPFMTMPGGPTGYGFEPTESPNSAASIHYSKVLFFCTISLWGSLFVGSYI